MPGEHGRRLSKEVRENLLLEVARLDRFGYSQGQIAEKVGVSQPTVSAYIRTIYSRYREKPLPQRAEGVNKARAVLDDLRREAVEALALSKLPKQTHAHETVEQAPKENADGSVSTGSMTTREKDVTEGRLPAVEYLRLLRDLLGLDAPKVVDVSGNVTTVNWDLLLQEIPQGPLPDTINDRLELMIADASVQSGAIPSPPLPIGLKELPQTNGHPPTPTEE